MEGSAQQMPPQQYQQPYYPPAAPMPAKAPPPLPSAFLWIALIGVIILSVGLIINISNVFADDGETASNMRAVGNIIGVIGGLMLIIGLIVPAFAAENMDPTVRAGLLIGVAIIVGLLVIAL